MASCPLFDIVQPAFFLPTTASPTLQDALKDCFREAVVVCDIAKSCKLPSFDSYQKRFLWTHKEVHLAPHSDVGLVLQVEDVEKFPQALGFGKPGLFFQSQQAGSLFHSHLGGPLFLHMLIAA